MTNKIKVTRYCKNCKRTTKQELTMRGVNILAVRCLKCEHVQVGG